MAELISPRSVLLTNANRVLQSPTVIIPALTSRIAVRLQRPTTAVPLTDWNATGRVRVSIVMIVDGVEYRCESEVTGGVMPGPSGTDAPYFQMVYEPTILFGERARQYLLTATPDENGFYTNVPLTRIGELGSTVQAYLRLERLEGRIGTNIQVALTEEAPAPKLPRHHNSVAFDARTTGEESNGDGVLTVSHAGGSGSNRAAFVSAVNGHTTPKAGSCTYAGSAMTELWDALASAAIVQNAGYILAGITGGTQNVVSTLTGVTWDHIVGVRTFTGVDQTTPNGNQQVADRVGVASSTLTCTGVSVDDMVVDVIAMESGTAALTVGANQNNTTQGWTIEGVYNGTESHGSTQAGADGGAMSWSWTGNFSGYHGAVVIKTASAAAASRQSLMLMGCGR